MNPNIRADWPSSRAARTWLTRSFWAVLVLGGAAGWSPPAFAAPVWSDPLTGSQIDTTHWIGSTSTADVALATSSEGVLMSIAGSAHGASFVTNLASLCSLGGDFDFQVDYKLGLWPAQSGVRSALIASGQSGFGAAVQRDSLAATDVPVQTPGSEVYLVDFEPHSGTFPDVPTADVQGTLRLARSGSGITAYFASPGGSWTMISSIAAVTDPVVPVLQVWSGDAQFNKQSGGASVYFRNFVVNSGQLSCPDAGAGSAGGGSGSAGSGGNTGDAASSRIAGGNSAGCGCSLLGKARTGLRLLSLGFVGLCITALRRRGRG
jgi:hypothetical protein